MRNSIKFHRKQTSGGGKNRTQKKERQQNKRGTSKSVYTSKHVRQYEKILAKPKKKSSKSSKNLIKVKKGKDKKK